MKKTVKGKEIENVRAEISGSVEQDIFKTMLLAQRDEMLMMLGLSFMGRDENTSAAMQDSLIQMYTAMKEKTVRTIDSLVTNYPDCHATALIINNFVIKDRNLAEVEKMYEGLTPRIKNAYLGRKLKTSIDNIKKTSIGSVAPDFTLQAPDGKNVSLSDYRGKIVLLDFWASWCGPCRAENPNVVALYQKYKDKGLEILSVSLDSKREPWVKAIREDGLIWKHVSDLQGWKCSAAQRYKISAVPSIFVLDSDNRIVGSFLRGKQLEQVLDSLMIE